MGSESPGPRRRGARQVQRGHGRARPPSPPGAVGRSIITPTRLSVSRNVVTRCGNTAAHLTHAGSHSSAARRGDSTQGCRASAPLYLPLQSAQAPQGGCCHLLPPARPAPGRSPADPSRREAPRAQSQRVPVLPSPPPPWATSAGASQTLREGDTLLPQAVTLAKPQEAPRLPSRVLEKPRGDRMADGWVTWETPGPRRVLL